MIPEIFIQELINRIDIVDVIDKSVPLKKAGANYSACCPFHNEKSPSFTVSPTKQFYHCFGCGAHGTAIGFVMEYQGLSYVEAIHELAKMAGMIVPQETRDTEKPQQKFTPDMHESLQTALNFYRSELKKSTRAIDYLKARGLSGQIAARFQIGYAPDGWQNLQSVFSQYESETLETIGLVVKNEQGKRYDRFRDRIIFPIHDQKGQVIGFGGRVINPEDTPKYYNSPETPLFQKGHELYGLFLARRAIRDAGRALVVEGYMDVVALAQFGIDYAVAALGTATTPFHITKLMRQTEEIVFSFDGDAAGQKAAWRATMNALPVLTDTLRLKFLFLPIEHDPDSFVREFGKEQFELGIQNAEPLSVYIIKQLSANNPLNTQEDKVQFLNEAEPILQQIQAPRTSLLLQKKIAELANISLEELQATLKLKPIKLASKTTTSQRARPVTPILAKKLLQVIMHQPQLSTQIDLNLLQHDDPVHNSLRMACQIVLEQNNISAAQLLQRLQGSLASDLLNELSAKMMEEIDAAELELEFSGAIKQLNASWEKTESTAAEILQIAQERGLQALSDEQKAILQKSRWGHADKNR